MPRTYKVLAISPGCPRHLILTETRRQYHHPHFTAKEAKAEKLNDLTKALGWEEGMQRFQTLGRASQSSLPAWPYPRPAHKNACEPISRPCRVASWLIPVRVTQYLKKRPQEVSRIQKTSETSYPGFSQRSIKKPPRRPLICLTIKMVSTRALCTSFVNWSLSGLRKMASQLVPWDADYGLC